MEDIALEASASMHNRIHHQTDQWKFQHHTNWGMIHSQTDQHELIRLEPTEVSEQPRAGRGCKDKLSEEQKKEKKRQCDVKYRLKKKIKENEMTVQNKCLREEIGRLSTENRHLKEETGRLTTKNRHLEKHIRQLDSKGKLPPEFLLQREDSYISQSTTSQVDQQSVFVQNKMQEEIGRLSTENRHLKEETGRLTTENRHLEEHIKQLESKGKLPVEVLLQRQDCHISQSTSQYKKECVQIITSINITTQRYMNIEAENSGLRAQSMELSQRLKSLEEILTFLNASNYAFDAEDTSVAFSEPAESDSFLSALNLAYLNQPIVASADVVFQY